MARAEVLFPADAHVIGEAVTVTQIRHPGLPRVGLLATCRRARRAIVDSKIAALWTPGSEH